MRARLLIARFGDEGVKDDPVLIELGGRSDRSPRSACAPSRRPDWPMTLSPMVRQTNSSPAVKVKPLPPAESFSSPSTGRGSQTMVGPTISMASLSRCRMLAPLDDEKRLAALFVHGVEERPCAINERRFNARGRDCAPHVINGIGKGEIARCVHFPASRRSIHLKKYKWFVEKYIAEHIARATVRS